MYKEINKKLYIAMMDSPGESIPKEISKVVKLEDDNLEIVIANAEAEYKVCLKKYEETWLIEDIAARNSKGTKK